MNSCFVCAGKPFVGTSGDFACERHTKMAVTPEKLRLMALIDEIPHGAQRAWLPDIVNPVQIEDSKGWWGWLYDIPVVCGERVHARDYFEFRALHEERYNALLHSVSRYFAGRDWMTLDIDGPEFARHVKSEDHQALHLLSSVWDRQQIVARAREQQGGRLSIGDIKALCAQLTERSRQPPKWDMPRLIQGIIDVSFRKERA